MIQKVQDFKSRLTPFPFGNTNEQGITKNAQFNQHFFRHTQLTLTTIDKQQIRQRLLFIPPCQHLLHGCIVIAALDIMNGILTVITPARTALIKYDAATNGRLAHGMRDIKTFNAINGAISHLSQYVF